MRVVVDTNILVSAILVKSGHPATIYRIWRARGFHLLTCEQQTTELRSTLHKPALAARIKPHLAGRLINDIREQGENIHPLTRVRRSPDPTDDFLLALCEAGKADYLVTGDKSGLLLLVSHKGCEIISAGGFAALFEKASRAGGQ